MELLAQDGASAPPAGSQLLLSFLSHAWADASPVPSTSSTYHAMIGGVVAVIVFLLLSLLIVLGHYLIRHKGTAWGLQGSPRGAQDCVPAAKGEWEWGVKGGSSWSCSFS